MYTQIEGSTETRPIHETSSEVTISVKRPSNMSNCNEFYVVRSHEGKVDILECTYDKATDTISFKTKLFSDYALVGIKGDGPIPTPTPYPKKKSQPDLRMMQWMMQFADEETDAEDVKATEESTKYVDRDTYKSEVPAKSVVCTNTKGAESFFDLKVHSSDAKTEANQKLLAQYLVGANVNVLLTKDIYPRRDLALAENGSIETLTWNNLDKNQAGPVFAIVYNQTDGAYVINGVLDANGTATFAGFKLRPASTITICK